MTKPYPRGVARIFSYICRLRPFLGVQSSFILYRPDNMDWGQHISEISSKATKDTWFPSQELGFCT